VAKSVRSVIKDSTLLQVLETCRASVVGEYRREKMQTKRSNSEFSDFYFVISWALSIKEQTLRLIIGKQQERSQIQGKLE
jgi:hypothetical protein